MVNPDDYIITKKRKKYKFALFANSPLCFELEQWQCRTIDCIELAAGTGQFAVELAARHPDMTFAAVDVKADRLQKGAYEAMEKGVTNIVFIRARANQLLDIVPALSVQSLWITFPDPFPKSGSSGRRLMHPQYLRQYAQLLSGDGSLYFKHDSTVFFNWSLEQLVLEKWSINELSFDLHDSGFNDEYCVKTVYETRWLSEGLTTKFVRATPPKA